VTAEALGHIRSRGCIPLLFHLVHDAEASVRTAAFAALAMLTNQGSHGEDLAAWQAWWKSVEPRLVITFEFAMPTAKEPLSALLESWKDAAKRRDVVRQVEILRALREHPENGEREAIALMLGALKSSDRTVRIEACRAVAWNRLTNGVPPLMALVTASYGKDHDVAKAGLLALAQIGDLRALKVITDSPWSSKDGEVFWVRLHVARYFRSPRTVDWLVSIFTVAGSEHISHYAKVVGESLEHLTGEGFGQRGREWKSWWQKAEGRFRPEALPDDYRVEWLFDDAAQKK
jgi:hypothetical protein